MKSNKNSVIHKNPATESQVRLEKRREKAKKERRSFLDMMTKTGISASLLRSSSLLGGVMAARYASAAGEKKRVIYCYIHSGSPPGTWLPQSTSSMKTLSTAYGPSGFDVAGLCHFREVNTEVTGHIGVQQALGKPDYDPHYGTIDTQLASVLGATTPYSSIYLGSNATASETDASVIISTGGLPKDDPQDAVNAYFKTPLPSTGNDNTYEKAFAAQYDAINAIKAKLSTEEHQRLDQHFDALKKIEDRIVALSQNMGPDLAACTPQLPANYDKKTNDSMVEHAKLQADILIAALKCGLTNVGVLQLGNHNGAGWTVEDKFNNLHNGHSAAHSAPQGTFEKMMAKKMEVPAYFIKRLNEEVDENGSSLLETTAFVQVTCMGNGISHLPTDAPFLLASKMPGFKTGFSSKQTSATARNFHAAVLDGMGLPSSQFMLTGAKGDGIDIS